MRNRVFSPWWLRLALYVAVALTGLIATAVGQATPEAVDGWLAQAGTIAAVLGGVVAALNTGPNSDNRAPAAPAAPVVPVVGPEERSGIGYPLSLPVYRGISQGDSHAD